MTDKLTPEDLNKTLEFDRAKDLTIEEAVRKEAELKAGITEKDSVLDKYIKQNREEVDSQKFENTKDLSELRTSDIENYIADQRQRVTKQDSEADEKAVAPAFDTVDITPLEGKTDLEGQEGTIGLGLEDDMQPFYKKKALWISLAAALLLGGTALGWTLLNNSKSSTTSSETTQTTETTKTATAETEAKLASFNELYATFFVDENQTKLKNSEFDKLSSLEEALKALEGTDYYEDAKAKYDRLSKSITAIQAVNDKFESPVIVDGEKIAANLKAGASLDDLSATDLNTGNASLDTLLQAVVAEARTGFGSASGTTASSGATATNGTSVDTSTKTVTQQSATSESTAAVASSSALYGIQNYDSNSLQRDKSRVPYDFTVIADGNNPSWTFNPGVLEKIVATSQERGYISGNDYILEKVNIINGNGYYNMFKPDGTYLFSINCKTGYFVGNARGNADALDY